ncbi:MAG: hypothetical protein WHT47_07345 [Hydrogenothermaceae bacterium]
MLELIIRNIVAVWLLIFLGVGLLLSWKIKVMRYMLLTSIFLVIAVTTLIEFGGLKVEWVIAKSGYIALFSVWLTVLIVFVVGMYKMWKNYGSNQNS